MKMNIFIILVSATVLLSGCNTVKGTVDGVGKDFNSVFHSNQQQADTNTYQHNKQRS
jgi:predicted small secreted protein